MKRVILTRWQKWMVGICFFCFVFPFLALAVGVQPHVSRHDVVYWGIGADVLNHPQGQVALFDLPGGVHCEWMTVPRGRTLRVESALVVVVVGWMLVAGIFGAIALLATGMLVVKDYVFAEFAEGSRRRKEEVQKMGLAHRFDVISAGGGGKLKEVEQKAAPGGGDDGGGER